ncbi:MAG: hypothetical protein EXX96DRAFT_472577 [Benjaminiella poitrasii]|nr:MAG: hypothetical protein EXX96DRAFT_472577 [Benjaminiella poitrasii]
MIAEERHLDWNSIQILFSRDVNEQITKILDQLPTLDDVLYRKSQPPICLYNYYIVLRDRLGLEMLLDFWLDVTQADLLYKRYIKHIKSSTPSSKQNEQALSSSTEATTLSMSSLPLAQQNPNNILTTLLLSHPRPSTTTNITADGKPRKPLPTREEMIKTIERIYLRYIVPNAEKEIDQLPQPIKDAIGHHFRNYYSTTAERSLASDPTCPDNPIIYVQAKEYVHQLLQSTFIIFLYYKVLMNLTLPQQIGRLACGLFSLFIGFSLEFSLIFLDIRPWQKRLWV